MVYVYKKSFAAGEVLRAADVNTYLTSSRNLLLNGDFSINQRDYVSGANLASGVFGFDRWKSNFTNTTLTYTSAPQGQMVTINSGGGLKQVVEQANIVAESYTLSWDGTATGRVYKSGTTAPAYASSPITVSLDGTGNVDVEFTASGGTKTLHNVQLEIGSSATPFYRQGITIGGELALCQRYFYSTSAPTSAFGHFGMGFASATTSAQIRIQMPVTMRAEPILYGYANLRIEDINSAQNVTSLTVSTNSSSSDGVTLDVGVASGLTAYRPYWLGANNNTSAYVKVEAEL